MRADALVAMSDNAEFWDFNVINDQDTGDQTLEYFHAKDIKVTVLDTQNGGVIVFTREYLPWRSMLRNIKDKSGMELLGPGLTFSAYVGSTYPVFDVFGNVMGYRSTLNKDIATKVG